jgi:hypothetical protein
MEMGGRANYDRFDVVAREDILGALEYRLAY